jgi:hypothetical protein
VTISDRTSTVTLAAASGLLVGLAVSAASESALSREESPRCVEVSSADGGSLGCAGSLLYARSKADAETLLLKGFPPSGELLADGEAEAAADSPTDGEAGSGSEFPPYGEVGGELLPDGVAGVAVGRVARVTDQWSGDSSRAAMGWRASREVEWPVCLAKCWAAWTGGGKAPEPR